MDNTEPTFDPYLVTITFERSWSSDIAIASQSPNMTSSEAIRSMITHEINDAIKKEAFVGKLTDIEIKPPENDVDIKTFHMAKEVMDALKGILVSTLISHKELKDNTWNKLIEFLKLYPQLLNTKSLIIAGKTYDFPADQWKKLQQYKEDDKRILSIKLIRDVTRCSLKDAKEATEHPANKLFGPCSF